MSSTPDYHKEFTLTRPLRNEFLSMSTTELLEDRQVISELIAQFGDRDADLGYLEWYAGQVTEEIERRRERFERNQGGAFPPVWPDATDLDRMRAEAEAIKDQVSVERYLASQVPWIDLHRSGKRLKSLCPYPDHHEKTPSFVIFEDGGAWCFGCGRGGDIFRIIGLIEGLPRFRDQLQRALEFAPGIRQRGHRNRPSPARLKGAMVHGSSRKGGAAPFTPIKIGPDGRVSP